MAVILDLTLSFYVYIIAGIVVAGSLLLKSMKLQRHAAYKKKIAAENLVRLKDWRAR